MIFLFLQCVSPVIISPLNSYLYIHWILDFKKILLLLLIKRFLSIPSMAMCTDALSNFDPCMLIHCYCVLTQTQQKYWFLQDVCT